MLVKDFSSKASPLSPREAAKLQELVSELSSDKTPSTKEILDKPSSDKLAWLSGYFFALSQMPFDTQSRPLPLPDKSSPTLSIPTLSILYASQTGNAKALAEEWAMKAKTMGFHVSLLCAEQYKPRNLIKETHLIFITSTHGEGEPPDNALCLHEFLQSKKASRLDKLQYAVLGLGDTSYEFFCQTGKDFDDFFKNLGAKPMAPRLDCDVEYDSQAQVWYETLLKQLKESMSLEGFLEGNGDNIDNDDLPAPLHIVKIGSDASPYNKKNPYSALFMESQKITGRDSSKGVYHVEISLGESGLSYQPGDALGVFYINSDELVEEILETVSLTGDEIVEVLGASFSLRRALKEKYCITASNLQQVIDFAKISGCEKLLDYAENNEKLRHYVNNTPFIDVLNEKKTALSPDQLISLLYKITPRLYSIASSQKEVEDEVHLTVGLLAFDIGHKRRFGGASNFLSRGLFDGSALNVFIEENLNFKLPEDDNIPIIMIGPGTGIAPFRGFMQEREAREAKGKNWLFFGDRTFSQDFLYQVEWQTYLKNGLLTHIDLAFSRDKAEKVYVQHKIIEQGKEVWQWLQEGAYLYVCGERAHMAKDVHEAFIRIITLHGGMPREEAKEYLSNLRKAKRYQKDVY